MRQFLIFMALILFAAPADAAERWAALASSNEAAAPVAWGKSQKDAAKAAVEACNAVSKTCSSNPATTNNLRAVFAEVCCLYPKMGCVAAAAKTVDAASNAGLSVVKKAGYSACTTMRSVNIKTAVPK
jgi:prophage DNA circulation protein